MPEDKIEISQETFAHLVELAALALRPDEADYLHQELNSQLSAIQELAAIDIPVDTQPASHGVPYTAASSQGLRADDWQPCENADAILEQAPEIDERYLIVPDIPHTTLE